MPPNRERTLEKLKEACNQALGSWKRAYSTAARYNKSLPKPLSIAQIARTAEINPKTIHVNPDFKEIVMYAVAQTHERLGMLTEPDLMKTEYSKEAVRGLVEAERTRSSQQIEAAINSMVEAEKKAVDLQKTVDSLEKNLRVLFQENARLNFENEQLKMRLRLTEGEKA